ncbi:LytR C-terminal domain-containing protein [Rudaeicoccus suwonensis]|uniref:LytR cell envelope-related transcriptional attenuator n=1 Tax=Rudaeicoccus suwonensis TaxID=657409 RepID=A0A561E3A5_9MICO|nr:LytR C-terminal domain-containing protein [Rudaeicoccus suwonensis]TWE10087.1 LytR cell envelope-related transcriptional attenuator [Rudaeicoccus suwonensis]
MGEHTRRDVLIAAVVAVAASPLAAACGSSKPKKVVKSCETSLPAPTMKIALNTIWVNVWNASSQNGMAAQVAQELQWRGLHIIATGNDPESGNYPTPTYAQIRYGSIGRQIALTLAEQVENPTLEEDDRADPSVDLVIGDKFALVPLPPAPASQVSLNVYNAYVVPGSAQELANAMRSRGFQILTVGNDPEQGYYPNDAVVIRYGAQGLPDAQRVQLQVKGAQMMQDSRTGTTVDLVIGSKWVSTSAVLVPTAQATPTPTPTRSTASGC